MKAGTKLTGKSHAPGACGNPFSGPARSPARDYSRIVLGALALPGVAASHDWTLMA